MSECRDHDRFQTLIGLAAVSSLSAEESNILDAHLASGCAECTRLHSLPIFKSPSLTSS